ncbi:MAG: hypothetical protein CVU34_09910 [Betaproteobacteria bacterium HGW-Betaproteobacteria-7]|jgi:hypothetical protein|nr:MAG: hypothetical protein CVU34_09910 [Betaproteobacteria bacterium HGW-Betaproteobacteria-7]
MPHNWRELGQPAKARRRTLQAPQRSLLILVVQLELARQLLLHIAGYRRLVVRIVQHTVENSV